MRNWIDRTIWGAAVLGWLPSLLKFVQWLFNVVGGIDLAVERIHDPGWIGSVVNWCSAMLSYMLNLPPWSYLLMIVAGVVLIILDRRFVAIRTPPPVVAPTFSSATVSHRAKQPQIAIEPVTMHGLIADAKALSAARITNVGEVALTGCVAKAEDIRAMYKSDASSVVSKPMEGIPNPLVLRTEGQLRNQRGGGFNLRIGESKNIGILWRNKNGKGPRYLIGEDGAHYPISNSLEMTIVVYGTPFPAKNRFSIGIGNSVETSIVPDAEAFPSVG